MGNARSQPAQLHELGVRQYNAGKPAASLRTLHRALRVLERERDISEGDRATLGARIWTSIAVDECELRSIDAGLAALVRADELATSTGDRSVLVLVHAQRGLVQLRRGAFAAAREALDAAVALLGHAQPREQASALLNRGTVGLMDGRLREARRDLTAAADIARAAELPVELFKALHNLAYLEFLAGDLPRALHLMDAAGRVDADVSRGVWFLDRARVLVEAGLAREADQSLVQAAEIAHRDRLAYELSETLLERARCALAMGDAVSSRRLARMARDRFARRGGDGWRRGAALVVLQAELAAQPRSRRVLSAALRLRNELEQAELRLPARLAGLVGVEALLALGRIDDARAALAELGPPRRADPITGRLYWQYLTAQADASGGDHRAAARRIRSALNELARYQASFGSVDLRTASAVHGRRLAELDITLALASARPAAVFAAAERARAVSSRLPQIRPPDDLVAADLLAELRQAVESLRAAEQDKSASEVLLARRRELERQLVARSWTLSGSGTVARPASLDAVRGMLGQRDKSLVTYVQAAGALNAVVIGRRVRVVDLGPAAPALEAIRRVRADLDVLAHPTLPDAVRATVRASLTRSLARLDETLIRPLAVDGPLVVVSTGLLSQLPWASLPSLRGRPLVVAPSATKWLACTESSTAEAARVVALAGPGLGRGDAEVAGVAGAWPGGRGRPGASASELIDAMAAATVLHVAAHGVHQPENPLFSFVRMVDGPVFAHELDQRGHAPEHVILSACEVGLATIRPGDEALGLASVLLNLGTRSVIASVARVGDDVAERTMLAYHARLASGADSATSLAGALEAVDSDVVPPFVTFGAAWPAPG